MGTVDVQRAIRSMTVPPPRHREPGAAVVEDEEPEATPIRSDQAEGAEFQAGECDQGEAEAREALIRLRPVLRVRPQPLNLILELLEVEFDLQHGCAERLFWLAHERGYLNLDEGRVSLGEMPVGADAGAAAQRR
jgi:hypothetical protein